MTSELVRFRSVSFKMALVSVVAAALEIPIFCEQNGRDIIGNHHVCSMRRFLRIIVDVELHLDKFRESREENESRA